ncbi:aminotransferase class I/II-fold pyridoxal phosphate-dependent enzyme [Pseudonocardia xishanensis]|uniref:aminotransferase class I/II-fold pyridoxal phosphate-dependent enzyme n=1 Tax=Pseudonocardia xishanensis TaxID=630995 RepID=UPI0031ED9EC9
MHVPTRAEDGWAADPAALAAAVTPATRALLMCNPNNPTGHTPTHAQLSELVDLAAAGQDLRRGRGQVADIAATRRGPRRGGPWLPTPGRRPSRWLPLRL